MVGTVTPVQATLDFVNAHLVPVFVLKGHTGLLSAGNVTSAAAKDFPCVCFR